MNIMSKLGGGIAKAAFQLKQHSPAILVVSGVIGVVASAVLACKATLKVNDVLEQTKEEADAIHALAENAEQPESAKKELAIVYAKAGIQLAKLYLPSVGLGALSIAGIIGSHHMLSKRNLALAAAYAAVDGSFKEYRSRLIGRFGEAVDKELRYNMQDVTVEEIIINENGETTTVDKTIKVADINTNSDYARYYDHTTSAAWEPNGDYNHMFLRAQQNLANDMLRARGYLFLNDVYEMLGIQRSIPGQVVGWVYDKMQDVGDNYVDFGIAATHRRSEWGEFEPVILLDFNVDGNIWDRASQKALVTT